MSLQNRLIKKFQHTKKWAKRTGISCFRVYHNDIPEYPLEIDWYEGDVVAWLHPRTRDDSPEKQFAFETHCKEALLAAFSLDPARLHLKYRYRQSDGTQYKRITQDQNRKVISEQGLHFVVNLSDYLDTGIFLDHRNTRNQVRGIAAEKRVLNLFAYTGSFSCYALAGQAAEVVSVDISNTYSKWIDQNLELNGFEYANHRLITEDCLTFLENTSPKKTQYDIIICDPPTFSNSKRMKKSSFAIDRDQLELFQLCQKHLAPDGILLFSTNSKRFRLNEEALNKYWRIINITEQSIPWDFRNTNIHKCWKMQKIPI